jgi:hypothetical protein
MALYEDAVLHVLGSMAERHCADVVGFLDHNAPIAEVHAILVAGRARRLGREDVLDVFRRESLPAGTGSLRMRPKRPGLGYCPVSDTSASELQTAARSTRRTPIFLLE